MKNSIAKITPMLTAITRSVKTVRKKVVSSMNVSYHGACFIILTKWGISLILYATTQRIAASAQRGTELMIGARTRMIKMSVMA